MKYFNNHDSSGFFQVHNLVHQANCSAYEQWFWGDGVSTHFNFWSDVWLELCPLV